MKDNGSFIKKKCKESGMTITYLVEKINKSRTAIYEWFKDPNLSTDKMIMIAEAINYDIYSDFPNLKKKTNKEDPFENKYYKLLEKYNDLLEKYNISLEKHRDILKR